MAAAAVISISSSKVAALAALFVVLAMYAEAASPNGGWQAAKATWYGAPNGAGPDDNGTCVRPRTRWLLLPMPVCMSDVVVSYLCRRRVRVQEHQPVPVHVHDVVR